jgi:transcriptional regulator with XRE-family HTH domain
MATRFSPANLEALLDASGLRPEHLALATNRSFYAVRGWMKGHCEPPARAIATLADTLGCDPGDLFEQTDEVSA